MNERRLQIVLHSISAGSPERLSALMLLNNAINSKSFDYMPPSKEGKLYRVWFAADAYTYVQANEKMLDQEVKDKPDLANGELDASDT